MFSNYVIYDPVTDNQVLINKLSYVGAGLFGIVYFVLKAGRIRFWEALATNVVCWVVIAALPLVAARLPSPEQQFLAIFCGVPVILAVQASRLMLLVKSSYRRRQWIVEKDL